MSHNFIIIGAGEVGRYLTGILCDEKQETTVIEHNPKIVEELEDLYNARFLTGSGVSAELLIKAGISDCSCFLALTDNDLTNMVACSLAKTLGAKQTLARIHDEAFLDRTHINYRLHFDVDYFINPEALCAIELAKPIRSPGKILVEIFSQGYIEMRQIPVAENSAFLNQPLRELNLDKLARIGFIQSANEFIVPNGNTQLKADDLVTLIGPRNTLENIAYKLNPSPILKKLTITLFGATATAIALAKILEGPRFNVRIIEQNLELCKTLAERFPRATIINGDGRSKQVLEEESVGNSDYFIACSKDDEDNIMSCLQAKKLGAKNTQMVINRSDYENILEDLKSSLNINLAVSPRISAVQDLRRLISKEPAIELKIFPDGSITAYEIIITPDSPAVGKTVTNLGLPIGAVIVGLSHKYEIKVPAPDDVFLSGDRIVIILQKNILNQVLRIFDL